MNSTEPLNVKNPAVAPSLLNDGLDAVRDQLNIQGQHGNWNYDQYMHGMYNGLECALATLENRAPAYKTAPTEWLCDKASDGVPVEASNVK
jgi:hypothetical protein